MLADIESAGHKQKSAFEHGKSTKSNLSTSSDFVEIGFGFDYRVMQFRPGFAALDTDELLKQYAKTTRRLLIFDYGGTLSWTLCLMDDEASMHYFNQYANAPLANIDDDATTIFPRNLYFYIMSL
jgi:hypothetical protein